MSQTREDILEAAKRVMRTKGLARSTTKEIARQAGYSEGSLYKHFESKEELFLCVLTERLPTFVGPLKDLPGRAGQGTVRGVLGEVAGAALAFFTAGMPITASIFAEPALLARHREAIHQRGGGPQKANEAVTAYLKAEQGLGRVREDADPAAAAAMLLGACYQRAFFRTFLGEDGAAQEEEARWLEAVVETLMRALSPQQEG